MVQDLIDLLPDDVGTVALIVAIAGCLVGAGLWIVGSRFSRPIVTLLTVLLGATVGMHLPVWCGWEISGAGPAVGGALLLGVTGYVLHGMWVGIGLGTVLALWAAMACWIGFRHGVAWSWPDVQRGQTIFSYLAEVWRSMPADVTRIMPYACATAMVSGLGLAIIWPNVSRVLAWSMAGVTLLAGMGVAAVDFGRPEWLVHVPSPLWAQLALLTLLVALGSIVQWKLGPRPAAAGFTGKRKSNHRSRDDDFDDDD
ncbi:hypothetical protein [Fontivita pretiosa]|uniref:hypothetical protein n=1 Tax=Fontivita pretiosa TaxID=2989684 RepID=UPI003D177F9D